MLTLWFSKSLLLFHLVDFSETYEGHGDHGSTGPVCMRNIGVELQASYLPGIITVDGDADDWSVVDGHSFTLLQAITDDAAHPYPEGDHSMQIKVAHDGKDVFFLIQVPGAYVYKSDSEKNMASVALIFGVGDDATYHNMGGCPELTMTCNSSTCSGHEVDLMHFYLNKAIPGRLYGSNLFDNINGTGRDSFGNLDDAYCWNPHCRYVDGADPYGTPGNGMNDWSGSWSHSTIDTEYGLVLPDSPYGKVDESGTYTFEFARPLRTNDQLQQDVQFTIGATHRMAAAFWYPLNNEAWESSQHYSASCDWLTLEILPGIGTGLNRSKVGNATVSAFSLLLSLAALSVSVAVGWWVRQTSRVASFNPIVNSL
ncbi:unnamed protein product [Sphagnum jensenii]|uniref:Cytochrome c-552/DMSO reductase-like haem-binding domain-containing protein n=1 Tax=Sphagnum jensenii TaxID=128206 RepID=A0ABP1B0W8_9BRYO